MVKKERCDLLTGGPEGGLDANTSCYRQQEPGELMQRSS